MTTVTQMDLEDSAVPGQVLVVARSVRTANPALVRHVQPATEFGSAEQHARIVFDAAGDGYTDAVDVQETPLEVMQRFAEVRS